MKKSTACLIATFPLFFTAITKADVPVGYISGKTSDVKKLAAGCANPATSTYMEFNNARVLIHTGGDMWWDLQSTARYEIPKGGGAHSLFSGSLWLGGTDVNGQLRIAAQRYREKGVDFWTGPLSQNTAEITPDECEKWDKHFVVTRKMVDEFRAWFLSPSSYPNYTIPDVILNWPAHGDASKGQAYYLAPFYDNDGDGMYDPYKGDYPYYDLDPKSECNRSRDRVPKLYGDYTLWWVFNDKGNVHMETGSDAIGMEIHAQAFCFATQDEINNMTFYNYILINRSTYKLIDTYFGTNFDVDVGCASDDYVGCDVQRGLGYAYNGDATDGSPCDQPPPGDYGNKTPAVGIDFFEGPYQDPDGSDNPKYNTITGITTKGTGENDLIAGGTYTGNADATFIVRISKVTPLGDYFAWQKVDGFCDTLDINSTCSCSACPVCTANVVCWFGDSAIKGKVGTNQFPTAQLLSDGIYISFNTSMYHTLGFTWLIHVTTLSSNNKMCDASINGLNFGDGVIDNERWGMRRFLYYKIAPPCPHGGIMDDPCEGFEYYRLLRGLWKDGSPMVYGGDGHDQNKCDPKPCIPTDFMFPGDPTTDPCGWGQAKGGPPIPLGPWNEVTAGNTPGDRRFVHSAGPFVLDPGAENDITTGVVWMRADDGNPMSSVELVRIADDKAQALFDNCFKLLNGPDAPCLTMQELDRELIIYLTNPQTSNNYLEQYEETDPTIPDYDTNGQLNDKKFRFEGYLIYQVKDSTVSVDELNNVERSRLVAEVDVKNNIGKIINYAYDDDMGIEVPQLMVDGENAGIRHTFQIKDDLFATGSDKKLVNFKKYYFAAIAYAYNNYDNYSPQTGDITGQHKPFLRGRKNCVGGSIVPSIGIPHKTTPEAGGTELAAKYGDSPEITRYEGAGNGGLSVSLSKTTEDEIFANGKASKLVYQRGKAPIDVKIVDPLNVGKGTFTMKFQENNNNILQLSKVKVYPAFISGSNYFEVTKTIVNELSAGDKIYVDGTSYFNGIYTVFEINGNQIVTCEHIPCNASNCSYSQNINGTIYLPKKYSWILLDSTGNTIASSDRTIEDRNEQLIPELGISISVEQVNEPGPVIASSYRMYSPGIGVDFEISKLNADPDNGFIEAAMTFSDNGKQWLTFSPDGEGCNAENWIRSGTKISLDPQTGNCVYKPCDDYFEIASCQEFDSTEKFEKVLAGQWAPFALASTDSLGPAPDYQHKFKNILSDIAGIDLIITPDETKWSRAVVLEMEEDPNFSMGKVPKFSIRDGFSIDKNGNASSTLTGSANPSDPNYISGKGMGWFPGYAINIETGERLNIMYGENSRMKTDLHGDDMIWNPTSAISSPQGELAVANGFCELGVSEGCPYWVGGMHYIFIIGNDIDGSGIGSHYDGGENIFKTLNGKNPANNAIDFYSVLKDVMWCGIPLLSKGYYFSDPHQIPSDVRIRLRVTKPYGKFASGQEISATQAAAGTIETGKYYYVSRGHALHNGNHYYEGAVFNAANNLVELDVTADNADKKIGLVTVIATENRGNPLFSFSLDEFVPRINDAVLAKQALDMIGIVPNPYLGMSAYETGALDNRVKIINLPQRCLISIYNVNGTMIRQFNRDNAGNTFLDWDLKNYLGVPVSSGVYVVHVSVPDVGDKTLKWFGVLRPVDLESF